MDSSPDAVNQQDTIKSSLFSANEQICGAMHAVEKLKRAVLQHPQLPHTINLDLIKAHTALTEAWSALMSLFDKLQDFPSEPDADTVQMLGLNDIHKEVRTCLSG